MDLTDIAFITRLSGIAHMKDAPQDFVTVGFFFSPESAEFSLTKNSHDLCKTFGFDSFVIEELMVGALRKKTGLDRASTKWFQVKEDGSVQGI